MRKEKKEIVCRVGSSRSHYPPTINMKTRVVSWLDPSNDCRNRITERLEPTASTKEWKNHYYRGQDNAFSQSIISIHIHGWDEMQWNDLNRIIRKERQTEQQHDAAAVDISIPLWSPTNHNELLASLSLDSLHTLVYNANTNINIVIHRHYSTTTTDCTFF